jgi:hypothetical protein
MRIRPRGKRKIDKWKRRDKAKQTKDAGCRRWCDECFMLLDLVAGMVG